MFVWIKDSFAYEHATMNMQQLLENNAAIDW